MTPAKPSRMAILPLPPVVEVSEGDAAVSGAESAAPPPPELAAGEPLA